MLNKPIVISSEQESLANAKVNARQDCVSWQYASVLIRSAVVASKSAKSREIQKKNSKLQQFQVIQGHPFPCKWDANNGLRIRI